MMIPPHKFDPLSRSVNPNVSHQKQMIQVKKRYKSPYRVKAVSPIKKSKAIKSMVDNLLMKQNAGTSSIFDKSVSLEMKTTIIEPTSSLGSTQVIPRNLTAAKKSQKA